MIVLNKIVLFLLCLALGSFLQASHVRWYSDYEKALLIAKQQNKPIMLYLRKKDCSDCQKIFTTTFLNKPYIRKINDTFISIIATYEDKNSYPIELFYTSTFPTIFFISPKDESFIDEPMFGYVSDSQLSKRLNLISIK